MPDSLVMPNGKAADDLFRTQTRHYRPSLLYRNTWPDLGLPPFTLFTVEQMRRDPSVKLGMAIKTTPIMKAKFTISADRPEVREFVGETLKAFWERAVPKLMNAMWYTQSGGELTFRRESDGLIHFNRFKQIYPADFRILTKNGDKWGLRVRIRRMGGGPVGFMAEEPEDTGPTDGQVILSGMKSFLYVHKREFGSWFGRSELEAAYPAWHEKQSRDGARDSRRMWYYKNAYDSGMIFHPPGDYVDPEDHTNRIPYQDLARQALEMAKNGHVMALPNVYDSNGNRVWEYVPAQMHGSGGDLVEYVETLDTEILRGLEIPDDVVAQVSGTGSFAGRTIPLMSFITSQNVILKAMVGDVKEQLLDPLCKLNYRTTDYEVEAEVNIDELMPSTPGSEGPRPNGDDEEQQQPPPDQVPGQAPVQLSEASHAPAGGVTVGGKTFAGGQFIPTQSGDFSAREPFTAKIAQRILPAPPTVPGEDETTNQQWDTWYEALDEAFADTMRSEIEGDARDVWFEHMRSVADGLGVKLSDDEIDEQVDRLIEHEDELFPHIVLSPDDLHEGHFFTGDSIDLENPDWENVSKQMNRELRRLQRRIRTPKTLRVVEQEIVEYIEGEYGSVDEAREITADDGQTQMSAAHAPKGGVTIGGKRFRGGEFIPSSVMAKATAQEKAKVQVAQSQQRRDTESERKAASAGLTEATWKTSTTKTKAGKMREVKTLVMPDGSPVPEHIAKVKVPPAWTDVQINLDPNADLLVKGRDAKGRVQTVYSESHALRQAAQKFARINELIQKEAAIRKQNRANLTADDEPTREAAAVMELIHATGLRPGSERDTKAAKQAYGATTLRAEHVVVQDDGSVRLQFTGKKGVDLDIPVRDPHVAAMLIDRKEAGGRLFQVSDSQLRNYVKTLNGGSFKPKDFRTLKGTTLAMREVEKMGCCPETEKQYKAQVKKVAEVVSQALGNTPTIALQSYINPTVFSKWRPAA